MNYTDRQKELVSDLINKRLNSLEDSIKYRNEEIKHKSRHIPNPNKLMEAELLHVIGEHNIKLAEHIADKFNLEEVLKTLV